MRKLVLCLFAVFALVVAASAAPAAAPTNFRLAVTINAISYPTELAAERDGVPTTGTFPHIGKAALTYGEVLWHSYDAPPAVIHWYWDVGVTFTTAAGDILALHAEQEVFPVPDTWDALYAQVGQRHGPLTLALATGRFESYSWTGSFTETTTPAPGPCEPDPVLPCLNVAITIEGNLVP